MPCSTLDYFPTTLDLLGFRMKGQPEPIDGVSLVPLFEGRMTERPVPIPFETLGGTGSKTVVFDDVFVPFSCVNVTRLELQRRIVPKCVNVTRQDCVTKWELNNRGEKVSVGPILQNFSKNILTI